VGTTFNSKVFAAFGELRNSGFAALLCSNCAKTLFKDIAKLRHLLSEQASNEMFTPGERISPFVYAQICREAEP
jgi:hypothetical protein